MSEIEEAVAKAISQKQLDEGDGLYDWYALTDEVADGYRDLARAAIQAYEAAKIESVKKYERKLLGNAGAPLSGLEQAYVNSILRDGFKP